MGLRTTCSVTNRKGKMKANLAYVQSYEQERLRAVALEVSGTLATRGNRITIRRKGEKA